MTQTDHFAWAIAFAKWPIFKIVSFLEYLVFFRAIFCKETLYCSCRMVFRMFFAFLIFDPNWPFCIGYSLCKMADFENCLISRIFGVFLSRFCTEQLYCSCRMVFHMFLAFLIFDPNWPFCMGYSLCKMADFQNSLISRIFGVFSAIFFTQNNSIVFVERFFACFWHF